MVAIPAGTFSMGASAAEIDWARDKLALPAVRVAIEQPAHQVSVKAFAMSATEITRNQFEAFVRDSGYDASGSCLIEGEHGEVWSPRNSWRDPGFAQGGDHPVVCVSHADAMAYSAWLSKRTHKTYRLPSEAEWEYAARANTTSARPWGWENAEACRYANVANSTEEPPEDSFPCADGYADTAPAGRFQPNAFGLYDMMGNVFEWTNDCYHSSYAGAPTDGSAWLEDDCSKRVLRSSSWASIPWAVRSTHRGMGGIRGRFAPVGFRVARTD
jgi:formylglycine-generating enzyme required for sulfatase activity